jgi:RNA polymerase sigma-70 factor (ECF subfamily)
VRKALPRPTPVAPDAATLDACRRGDRVALDAVLRAHVPVLDRLLTRLAGPSGDVEDLLQITLIEAVTAFPRFRGEASVQTWLCRIAVNVFRGHLRRPERRRRVALALVPEARDPVEPADPAPGPDHVLERRRQLARLYQHLEAIGAKKRIAFVLHVIEGRPISAVAALMRASEMATKSRVFWARRELLARVRKDGRLREFLEEVAP